jgi:carboxylesterase type B
MTTVVQQAPIVETHRGALRGAREGDVCVFRGIQYARPPVGELRFRPPVPPEPWEGVRDATRFGHLHIQVFDPVEGPLMHASSRQPDGDDCLNLNVWTPDPAAVGLPVLVWIHGGSLKFGAGSDELYDGSTFARDGVVTVTINYRLHPAGYLYVPGRPGAGAFGLLDQVAALEWVRDNIADFGGDPARVTVAGESAGAHSVGALLGAPDARGLFRRAVLQSGAASFDVPAAAAAVHGREVLRRLGVDPADDAALAAIDGAALLATSEEAERDLLPRLAAHGVDPGLMTRACRSSSLITSGGDVLPRRPLAAVAAGVAAGVDLLIGTTLDEAWLFPPEFNATAPEVAEAAFGTPEFPAPYRAHDDAGQRLITDTLFRIPAIRLAEAAVPHHARVFMYVVAWGSPPEGAGCGAVHAIDLPFMWRRIDAVADAIFKLAGRAPSPAFAEAMHGAWVRFITDGIPADAALPAWPAYDTTRRATMWLDDESRVVDDPMADERRAWRGVVY